jgi:hypothetical protein
MPSPLYYKLKMLSANKPFAPKVRSSLSVSTSASDYMSGPKSNHERHGKSPQTNGTSRVDDTNHSIAETAEFILDVKTLTKLCGMNASDAAELGSTLMTSYKAVCDEQLRRATAAEKIVKGIVNAQRQESTLDKNVAAHFDRFVREMEEAQTAMGPEHKEAMMIDAMNSIILAQENSELAREHRAKIERLSTELKATETEMMAARNKLVDLVFGAVMRCIMSGAGAVEVENSVGG